MTKRILFIGLILSASHSQAAILVEDNGSTVSTNTVSMPSLSSGEQLRQKHKVGVGLTAGGPLGFAGANLEFNVFPDVSVLGGFGLAPEYRSFNFQWKMMLGSGATAPYFSAGYARWFTTGENKNLSSTTPSFLYERFLTDSEKRRGQFGKNILFPSLGLQYTQLSGEWTGFSVFAEVVMLLNLSNFAPVPTGTIGMTYYM